MKGGREGGRLQRKSCALTPILYDVGGGGYPEVKSYEKFNFKKCFTRSINGFHSFRDLLYVHGQ